jgi:hypothetical protein
MLSEGFDDDDDKRTNEDESASYPIRLYNILFSPKGYNIKKDQADLDYAQRLLRYIIGGAANENLTSMSPYKLYNDMVNVPAPYLWQIENLAEAFAGTLALPFEIYENGLGKAVGEWAYQTSKTVPYGSNYRITSDAIQGLLNDYQKYYTKQD